MMNLNCQMDHILYQKFKIILSIFKKRHEENSDNPSIKIYINKLKIESPLKLKMNIVLIF